MVRSKQEVGVNLIKRLLWKYNNKIIPIEFYKLNSIFAKSTKDGYWGGESGSSHTITRKAAICMFFGGFILMQIQNAIHTLRVPFTRVALTYHSLPLLIAFFGESTGLGSTVSDWGACSYCCVESVLLSFVSKKFFWVTVCLGFSCTHPLCGVSGWMEGGTVNEPFKWK